MLISKAAVATDLRDNDIPSISDALNQACFFGRGSRYGNPAGQNVDMNTIEGYEVGGVEVADAGSYALISQNRLAGASVDTTQIGVRVRDGGSANAEVLRHWRCL